MPPTKTKHTAPIATKSPRYPYTVHRVYLCGHVNECMQIDKAPDTNPLRIAHTIVPQPRVVEGVTLKPYRQIHQRCSKCTKSQELSKAGPKSAESQSMVQGGQTRTKNGFLHVLVRERFGGRGDRPITWPEERKDHPGHIEYTRLKVLYEELEARKGVIPHHAVSYKDRVGRKTVEGPAREGDSKLVYVLQTAVDSALVQGLGYEIFDGCDGREGERVRLVEDINQLLLPSSIRRGSPVPTGDIQAGAQRVQSQTRSKTQDSPALQRRSRSETNESPQPQPQSPQKSARESRREIPRSNTKEQEEIAHNRAIALAQLEGRSLTIPPERHSDTTPHTSWHNPTSRTDNVPLYISHQRPFGPTRSSGGTTLSYGDNPRGYDRSPPQTEPGVSISAVMETLYSPPYSNSAHEEHESGRSRMGSYGSYRSFESQRHPGPGARSRGGKEMLGSERQGHSEER